MFNVTRSSELGAYSLLLYIHVTIHVVISWQLSKSVCAGQYRLTVSRAQFVNILYCMGKILCFTRAGLSCPIGISRFVPLRSRLLVTDNKTFIDQAWNQGGWILALFYLYHKLPLISAGLIQRCITEKALLTLGQKSGTHYQTKKKGERSIGAFKDRLDFLCLSTEVKFFTAT